MCASLILCSPHANGGLCDPSAGPLSKEEESEVAELADAPMILAWNHSSGPVVS